MNQPEKKNTVKKIPSQADILRNPTQFVSDLTEAEYTVLDVALTAATYHGNGFLFNQTYLGERKGFTRQTANRAVAKFKKLGLFLVKQRRKGCAYLSISNYFSFPLVRAAISHKFTKYPGFQIRLSMLLPEYVSAIQRETSCPDRQLFRIGLNRSSENERRANRDKKVNEVTIRKILDIERALVARGESLETMDTEKLAAFSMECLDNVSMQMRKAHPKQPFGFFVHLCMKWCKENNEEPVFAKADVLRQLGLLAKFRASRPAGLKEQIKTAGEPKKPDYAQQLRERQATEKRLEALERANLEDYLRRKKQEQTQQAKPRYEGDQLAEEITAFKWHVENLTERAAKGELGASTALMIAKGTLARREYELASLAPNTIKISTEAKVVPSRHSDTAPPTQIVRHMANLFSNDFPPEPEESDYDEDVPD